MIAVVVVAVAATALAFRPWQALGGAGGSRLPPGVSLRRIDGGPAYFARIDPRSAWMDRHILLGAWLEQPRNAREVGYDRATGDNIYWDLAGRSAAAGDCHAACHAGYATIRRGGTHVSAPAATAHSGSESVSYSGSDGVDVTLGPGWGPARTTAHGFACARRRASGGACGYTVARWYDKDLPKSLGAPAYPVRRTVKHQGYSKGVLFWEKPAKAAEFLKFTEILSADSYWMSDRSLALPAQGGCALFPKSTTICDKGKGGGLTTAHRRLPANYAYDVTRLERLQGRNGKRKPVIADVETGCPQPGGGCTTPAAMTACAWHALIAGARGILWFQHNFGGPCRDDRTIIDGSNPASPMYGCQRTPGVTLHDMVKALTRFNTEVRELNGVLVSPFAHGYARASGDVSLMAKDSRGVFYVFAGAGRPGTPPPKNQKVTFTLAGAPNGTVTVLGEHRTLPLAHGTFTDTFASQDTVHVYRVDTGGRAAG